MSFLKNNEINTQNSFKKNFFTLATGRILGQTIPILLTPFLTRLYLPQDFGIFAVFLAITAVLTIVSNGRYSLAIILPKKEKEVLNIFILSIFLSIIFSFLIFLLLFLFKNTFLNILNLENHLTTLYLIPLGILILTVSESLHFLGLRKKQFKIISITIVFQFALISILKISLAFLNIGPLGLILGHVLGYIGGILLFFVLLAKKDVFLNLKEYISKKNILQLAKEHKNFPKYSLPADTLNSFSRQMPNFLLNNFFGSTILGYYSLTQRVLGTPINLVSGSITDVFREKATSDFREKKSCKEIFVKTFKKLFIFSIIPFILLFLFSPSLVPYIFGQAWTSAGEYIRIMTILFFLIFSVTPVSSVLYITGKQAYKLIWEIVTFVFILISFYIGFKFFDEYITITLYTITLSFMYIVLLIVSYRFTEVKNEKI